MKWQILIPTIPEREESFNRLNNELIRQIGERQDVSVLSLNSKPKSDGGLSIGAKRQKLVDMATAEYISFVDDDDRVAPNYVDEIYKALETGKDIICFDQFVTLDNYWSICSFHMEYPNEQAKPHQFKRQPFHVCPHKLIHARNSQFPNKGYSEDWEYMKGVLNQVKTHLKINEILHHYNHSLKWSKADNNV